MATPPVFSAGSVLTAGQMNAVGLWLVKSDTIVNVSTKEITNAFTDDFTNYRVILSGLKITAATTANIFFRFGTVITDYYGTYYYDRFDGTATGTVRKNNQAELQIAICDNLSGTGVAIDIYSPKASSDQKSITGNSYGSGYSGWFAGTLNSSTTRTSFLIGAAGQTIAACDVKVYGYRP